MFNISAPLSKFYTLNLIQKRNSSILTLKLLVPLLTTEDIPQTFEILLEFLPTIFKHRCFNYGRLPFFKEVRKTETGHLFEHILLEYLLRQRNLNSLNTSLLKGNTSWNWHIEQQGIFHIKINTGSDKTENFNIALQKSVNLMDIILSTTSLNLSKPTSHLKIFLN